MPSERFKDRPLPDWFADAKFGLLIHWGPYSMPAWAERSGTLQELWSRKGPRYLFKHNPYAEWYSNTMLIHGSPTERHHIETFGRDFSYDNFVAQFNEGSAQADFSTWADLFAQAGARYVVLTTKHHDGYLLWPSAHLPPGKPEYHSPRDIVGGLTQAVRARGLRMGLYYSGGYDKLFNSTVISHLAAAVTAIPQGRDYAAYCDAHLDELIEHYQPSILWNDIAYPATSDLDALFARYYAAVHDGVVNDRWSQVRLPRRGVRRMLFVAIARGIGLAWPLLPKRYRRLTWRATWHHDFTTPEYEVYETARPKKWEAVRGIGTSFGNNRTETDADMLSPEELVHMLVDVVSKNGNLMLGIAPEPGGVFREEQRRRLLAIGEWLSVNGEGIYGTRPWDRAEGKTSDGLPVRFTCTDGALYIIVLGTPRGPVLGIDGLVWPEGAPMRLLGYDQPLAWEQQSGHVAVRIPTSLPQRAAWVVKITR
jgi:alpha-L-fucosidase